MSRISETETVIKKILPYLQRRGYDIATDLTFEEPVKIGVSARKGFIDILVTCGRPKPVFLIEAKRDGSKINASHRTQALDYGRSIKCPLVAVTNGKEFELLNTSTGKPLAVNGSSLNRIPSKTDLISLVLPQLKKDPSAYNLKLPSDRSLPFRPGLPLSKLNHLIKQIHNTIRKIEKNEEYAFSDFSKFLFLKLLEEKWDQEVAIPPYSYTFHELAAKAPTEADQVKAAIRDMISRIQANTPYGEVLEDPIRLKKDISYLRIVKALAGVSFSDSDLDSKGAAFEYFVRATLKGKKLGQYFTPRPLVRLMLHLGRWKQIVNSVLAGEDFKVLDPACGTGGFLVLGMNLCIAEIEGRFKRKEIHRSLADKGIKALKEDVFFGADANEGVACSAKMNMIVAGDGHNNIRWLDSLSGVQLVPPYTDNHGAKHTDGKAHLILTNPPFGTSESESLSGEELGSYEIRSTKGQSLFIQKMIASAHPESRIVTVIDEGVLNNNAYGTLRDHILKTCRVEWVCALPEETFKPNKINVRSSVLVLIKRSETDEDLTDEYDIGFLQIKSLGYEGSGEEIKSFALSELIKQVEELEPSDLPKVHLQAGYEWAGFSLKSKDLIADKTSRLDYRYWDPSARVLMEELGSNPKAQRIKEINSIETRRGKSPSASEYVSKNEGHALVVKAGSNINKKGQVIEAGDYIEEILYQKYVDEKLDLQLGDILISSTGDGTLGKCGVYRLVETDGSPLPAIADGHVTVVRVNQEEIYPEYLCDFLRRGFGASQITRLFTGSTGLIEITPEDIDRIVCPPFPPIKKQMRLSTQLRTQEQKTEELIKRAVAQLNEAEEEFYRETK